MEPTINAVTVTDVAFLERGFAKPLVLRKIEVKYANAKKTRRNKIITNSSTEYD